MKKLVQRILNGFLSLLTTFLIMLSPIAAVVYASQPTAAIESFSLDDSSTVAYAEPSKIKAKGFEIYEENDELLLLTFSTK
ncbi:MAG: hypothetical protein K0R55_602 [Sporomusa sp.]|jgi:hypothetical protein|nr:hypothetical protein [Sporomusa sp.]